MLTTMAPAPLQNVNVAGAMAVPSPRPLPEGEGALERAPGATLSVRVAAAQAVTSRTGRACAVGAPAIPVEHSPGPRDPCPEPLADGFGRRITDLRISVTDRCNLRCRYCMPEEGVRLLDHNRVLRSEEIIRVVKVAVGLGVRKVRLTGGEPLLRRGLPDLVAGLAAISGLEDIAVTTNGVLLGRYARDLYANGLRRVNVSLDTLRPERFVAITRRDDLHRVLDGIASAQGAGFSQIKVNMIPMRGCNDDEIASMARWAVANGLHLRYIEFMPFAGNGWSPDRVVSAAQIRATLSRELRLGAGRRETPQSPAVTFPIEGSTLSIGIIASVTQPFCERCSRMRLTAEGRLRPCLHADVEVDLATLLRSGGDEEDIRKAFRTSAGVKPRGHRELGTAARQPIAAVRPMVHIGG